MSVGNVQSNSLVSQLNSIAGSNRVRANDGDNDDNGQQVRRHQGGGFAQAIANALKQIGVSTSAAPATSSSQSTASDSNSTQDPAQALGSFLQNLMAALHAQNTQGTPGQSSSGSDSDGDNDGSTRAAHGRRHQFQSDLQSLIQQLSSSSSGSSNSSSGSGTSNDGLQQSFQNLMSALGDTSSSATLSNFLQALTSQFEGAGKSGNAVSTTA